MGKYRGGMGKCVGMFGRCGGCGEVWWRYERGYGVSVEVELKWGKVCWDAERCGDVRGAHTLFYTSFTPLPTPFTLT